MKLPHTNSLHPNLLPQRVYIITKVLRNMLVREVAVDLTRVYVTVLSRLRLWVADASVEMVSRKRNYCRAAEAKCNIQR